jgi:hypothetical protein
MSTPPGGPNTRGKKSREQTAPGSVSPENGKTAVGNGGPRRMTRNSLKAAGVSDLSQHIKGIDPVDDGRAESGLT